MAVIGLKLFLFGHHYLRNHWWYQKYFSVILFRLTSTFTLYTSIIAVYSHSLRNILTPQPFFHHFSNMTKFVNRTRKHCISAKYSHINANICLFYRILANTTNKLIFGIILSIILAFSLSVHIWQLLEIGLLSWIQTLNFASIDMYGMKVLVMGYKLTEKHSEFNEQFWRYEAQKKAIFMNLEFPNMAHWKFC